MSSHTSINEVERKHFYENYYDNLVQQKKYELLNVATIAEDHPYISEGEEEYENNDDIASKQRRGSIQEMREYSSFGKRCEADYDRRKSTSCLTKPQNLPRDFSKYNEKYVRNMIENPDVISFGRRRNHNKLKTRSKSLQESNVNTYASNDYYISDASESRLNERLSISLSSLRHSDYDDYDETTSSQNITKLSRIIEDEQQVPVYKQCAEDETVAYTNVDEDELRKAFEKRRHPPNLARVPSENDDFDMSLRRDFIRFFFDHVYPKYKTRPGLNASQIQKFDVFSKKFFSLFRNEAVFSRKKFKKNDEDDDDNYETVAKEVSIAKSDERTKIEMVSTDQRVDKSNLNKSNMEKKRKEAIQKGIKNYMLQK